MATNTAQYEVVLNTLTAKFVQSAQAVTPFYPEICYQFPSNRKIETFGMPGAMPGIREWTGDRIFKQLAAMDFSIENKLWESSLAIPKTNVDDDHMGLYGPVIENLAIEAANHPDELLFQTAIANGTSVTCWDGQYFFDTDHSWNQSGTQSNLLTYNASDHTAVTALEFRAAFDAARVKMLQYKNDQGKFFNRTVIQKLNSLICIVAPELETAAKTAFQANVLSNNSVVLLDMPRIVSSPLITTGTEWFLVNTASPMKPFVFQAREPLHTMTSGANDLETKDLKFMTQARYNIGYFAWWNMIKTTFN